ncbi:hypothetical protein DL93DRAFT_2103421 [Clavulina sp. PMI_390]|nr:hypothetical protein DL93DRAFT_2103421 [Clavulina sp. PMI_390]
MSPAIRLLPSQPWLAQCILRNAALSFNPNGLLTVNFNSTAATYVLGNLEVDKRTGDLLELYNCTSLRFEALDHCRHGHYQRLSRPHTEASSAALISNLQSLISLVESPTHQQHRSSSGGSRIHFTVEVGTTTVTVENTSATVRNYGRLLHVPFGFKPSSLAMTLQYTIERPVPIIISYVGVHVRIQKGLDT